MKDQDQNHSGLYQILWNPLIYGLVQDLFGKNKFYRILINDYLPLKEGESLLDIGCGTAQIVKFLPDNIQYAGFDLNKQYIDYAKRKYKNRVLLFNKKVSDADANEFNKFDYVLSLCLIHHLNDEEAVDLFRLGYNLLNPNGTMITSDPAWNKEDNFWAKKLTKNDRGKHVRYPNEYETIAKKVFDKVETTVRRDMINVPQSGCIMCCKKVA